MDLAPQISAVTLSLITCWAFLAPAPSWTTPATVTRVVDGDTIEVEIRRTVRIRMLDCWAPESKIDGRLPVADRDAAKRAGLASKAHLTLLAHGQQVIVQIPISPDGDISQSITLGRFLGNVWLESDQSQTLAEKQVAAGHATKCREDATMRPCEKPLTD